MYLHLTTEREREEKKSTVSLSVLPTPGNIYSILEEREILSMTNHLILLEIYLSYT